jgi:hypothetical protein
MVFEQMADLFSDAGRIKPALFFDAKPIKPVLHVVYSLVHP